MSETLNKKKYHILFCADMHGSKTAIEKLKKKAESCEIIVCAGDFSMFQDNFDKILKDLDSIGKPILMLHGNHEFEEDVKEYCKKSKNIKFIHKKFHKYKRLVFYGYGGGGFQVVEPTLEKLIPKIKEKFNKYKEKNKDLIKIIVFHGPPYGTALDLIHENHVGSKSKVKLIKAVKPNVVIAGHIHECNYAKEVREKTFLLNPGPKGRIIKFDKV
jgi:Icc-related predicted phosphoesterase